MLLTTFHYKIMMTTLHTMIIALLQRNSSSLTYRLDQLRKRNPTWPFTKKTMDWLMNLMRLVTVKAFWKRTCRTSLTSRSSRQCTLAASTSLINSYSTLAVPGSGYRHLTATHAIERARTYIATRTLSRSNPTSTSFKLT